MFQYVNQIITIDILFRHHLVGGTLTPLRHMKVSQLESVYIFPTA